MQAIIQLKCETANSLQSNEQWWRILKLGISDTELESKDVMIKAVKEKIALPLSAFQNNKLVGVAFIHLLKNPAAVFLDYLAIDIKKRGHHIGGILFEFAWEMGFQKLNEQGLMPIGYFGELDIPGLAKTRNEKQTRKKRIHFYISHNCKVLDQMYLLPPFINNKISPMYIFYRPAASSEKYLRFKRNIKIISAIYIEKYHNVHGVSLNLLKKLIKTAKDKKILSQSELRYASVCCNKFNINS